MYSSTIHVIHATNWFLLMDHSASFHSMRICPGRSLSLSPGLVNGIPRVAILATYSWHTAWNYHLSFGAHAQGSICKFFGKWLYPRNRSWMRLQYHFLWLIVLDQE